MFKFDELKKYELVFFHGVIFVDRHVAFFFIFSTLINGCVPLISMVPPLFFHLEYNQILKNFCKCFKWLQNKNWIG